MNILLGCEESQIVCIEFRKRGHEAFSCDLLPCSGGHPEWHIQGDVLDIMADGRWQMGIFFPPCTHLASSGARWFPEKRNDGRQLQAINFFMSFTKLPYPWAIENPVGIMSNIYRKPDQIIQPWYFGDPEPKTTCLWVNRLPKLIWASENNLFQDKTVVSPDFMRKPNGEYYKDAKGKRYSRIHFMSRNNPDRAKERSKTYKGIASAMATQWG